MNIEIILLSVSKKVLDLYEIKLATPGSAVGLATNCATGTGAIITVLLNQEYLRGYSLSIHKDVLGSMVR